MLNCALPDVVASTNAAAVLWFLNNGGNPLTFSQYSMATTTPFVASLTLGDFNNDGWLDIAGSMPDLDSEGGDGFNPMNYSLRGQLTRLKLVS